MKILIIGAGKMGEALIKAWLSKSLKLGLNITVLEINKNKLRKIKNHYPDIVIIDRLASTWRGDLVLLAVKPQSFIDISMNSIFEKINAKMVLSIMAGITLKSLENKTSMDATFIRAMPNLAASLCMGVTGVYAKNKINKKYKNKIQMLLEALGFVIWLKSEKQFNSLTAISGSGPAYFFLFFLTIKNMAKTLGFSNKIAHDLVIKTAAGALEIYKINKNLEKLISDVASPGGTTEAALKVLLKKEKPNLISILKKAILAANKKSLELGKNEKRIR